MCGESFLRKMDLKQHLDIHKEIKLFEYNCKDCGESFTDKTKFKQHLDSHRGMKCSCGMHNGSNWYKCPVVKVYSISSKR